MSAIAQFSTGSFPIAWVREQFPALRLTVGRRPAVFLDGPGGTQVPESVIRAVCDYYRTSNSNLGGQFLTSQKTFEVVQQAREALAEFFNAADAAEIIFGQNMTSLTFALSRVLAKNWKPGAEVIVTSLDHDANVSPWRLAAEEKNVVVKTWQFRKETCSLNVEDLRSLISDRTALIAVTLASNAVGSLVDVRPIVELAKKVGAMVFVDAVHFAPHAKIDVQAFGCDFLACSAYKFFGPHLGVLWARREWLASTENFKVRPASNQPPGKWETGTQSFESIAGTLAALEYLREVGNRSIGSNSPLAVMDVIRQYELNISKRFLFGIAQNPRITNYGITDPAHVAGRTPTFAIRLNGLHPDAAAKRLGEQGIFVWSGHFYALDLIERLRLSDQGGVIRIGFVHYNTEEEVDRTLDALETLR
jgi:cysteine desulfurase family protein (TIGR01976 family)